MSAVCVEKVEGFTENRPGEREPMQSLQWKVLSTAKNIESSMGEIEAFFADQAAC